MVKLPETLVLFVTVHGNIPVDSTPQTYKIPEGITVTKVSATAMGVCNITTEDTVNVIRDRIKTKFDPNNVEESLKTVFPDLQSIKKEIVQTVESQLKSEVAHKGLFTQYLHSSDRPMTIRTYKPGEFILNKQYARNFEGRERTYDFKINVMDVGNPDLLDILVKGYSGAQTRRQANRDSVTLDTSYLISFLQGQGVKHVVLFDYSCSTFVDSEGKPVTDRQERQFRSWLEKENFNGGKKTRRPKRKTKTRKARKGKTSWSY